MRSSLKEKQKMPEEPTKKQGEEETQRQREKLPLA
jgi:hypothetical protein